MQTGYDVAVAAKLLYRDATGKEHEVDVAPGGAFLGRAPECAVRTDDEKVSRRNCKVLLSDSGWIVEDLASSNGTFLNGHRINRPHPLKHQDVIRCGRLQVRFFETGPTAVAPTTDARLTPKDDDIRALQAERDRLFEDARRASEQLANEKARASSHEEDLAALRKYVVELRGTAESAQRTAVARTEELKALETCAEELRRNLDAKTGESQALKAQLTELRRDYDQLQGLVKRTEIDGRSKKQLIEELRATLAESEKSRDAVWKDLADRTAEVDHLRQVVTEQERLVAEQRAGLVALAERVKKGDGTGGPPS